MKTTFKVKGIKKSQVAINKKLMEMDGASSEGLDMAGEFIKGEAQKLTSVDEGILINTAFSKGFRSKKGYFVAVGYTAEYAAAVHEMPSSTNWNKPGAENKFLEKAVLNHLSKIFNIVKNVTSRIAGK